MQIEKLQSRRKGKKRCPNCFDLVEDKVVNRSLYALISFLVFLLLAYNLQSLTSTDSNQVSEITLGIPLPFNMQFQKSLSSTRTPTIFVRNKYNEPIEGVQGTIELTSILSPVTDSRPQCNTAKLEEIEDTLEWIRFGQICRAVISNANAKSNSQGLIQFPNFMIDRGPEGTYVFNYYTSDSVFSDSEQISVLSTVASIVVNTPPPISIAVGTQFSTQPTVTLTDQNGDPVEGKTVIAFTWIDSHFDPDVYDQFLVEGAKIGLLEGATSQPSDSSGVARFTNLKVTLSSTDFVHIFFCVDGKVVEPWLYRPLKAPAPGVPIPPQSRFPIFLDTTVTTVEIVTSPPASVTEGEVWSTQPKIRVKDNSGNPVAGQSVIAIGYGGPNQQPPYRFRNKLDNIPNKNLLNPIEGTYAQFDDYLQGNQAAFTPVFTDSNGEIQFTSLSWSTQGIASSTSDGQYFIVFLCNGVESSPFTQQVLSKVSNVAFSKPLESAMRISSTSQFDGTVRLRVTDSNGEGVSGKYITDATHSVEAPNADTDFVISTRNDLDQFTVSDENGFMAIPFKINIVKVASLTISFTFTVDDSTVTSSSITVTGNLDTVSDNCAYIEVQTPPPATATNGNQFTPVYKALMSDGNPWVGGSATLGVYFVTEYPYKIERQIINSVQSGPATATSDAGGVLTFTNFKFLQSPMGTLFLQVIGDNGDMQNCKSDFALVTVQATADEIALQSPKNSELGAFDQTVPLDTDQATTIRLLDENGDPITATQVTLDLKIAHMPVNLYSDYFAGSFAYTTFFTLSSTTPTSDGSGDITFNWKLGKGRSGYWTIIFLIDGKITQPFAFKTAWDSGAQVNIITQPAASGNQLVGNYLDSNGGPVIEVLDSSNNPMEGFMVSTTLIPVDGSGNKDTSDTRKQGMLDIYTTTLEDVDSHDQAGTLAEIASTFITLTGEKNGKTDASGRVTLDQLNIMDVEGSEAACFKFFFFIGTYEGGEFVVSSQSNSVCFINTMEVSITNTPSSKIAPNQVMATPVTLRVTKADASESDSSGLILLVASVSSVNRVTTTNKYYGSQSYFQNNVCIFFNKVTVAGGCSNINVINDGTTGSYIAETTFNSLTYNLIENVDLVLRFSNPFQFEAQFIDSSRITVVIEAENLEFIEQPPSQVELNEVFQVKVKATLTNGSPLGFVEVFANITSASTVSSFTDSTFNYAANLQTTVNNLNQLSGSRNIRLNREGASAITNVNGIATLSLQITGGVSGDYSVVVSSGQNVQSPPSNTISFDNSINQVASQQDLAQTHDVVKQTVNSKEVYRKQLDPQPIVSVTQQDETKLTDLANAFQVFVISEQDVKSAYTNLGLASGAANPGVNTILSNIKQPSSESSEAVQTITNAWKIFTKGASDVGAAKKQSLSSSASFTAPTLNSDNNYVFSDLTISVTSAKNYQIIFMVDGVESDLSNNIVINDKDVQSANSAVRILLTILTFLVLFLLLYLVISSNSYTYSKCLNLVYIVISVVICIIFLILTIRTNYTLTLKIFMSITIALIITSLVYAIIQLFSKRCRRYIFYVEWQRAAKEYTYQKLFKRPSSQWNTQKGKKGLFSQKKNKESTIEELNKRLAIVRSQSDLNSRKGQLKFGEFFFFKKKMSKRIVDLFVPFQVSANRLNLGDCFFYPQRFFIGFLIAFVGFLFIAINLFLMIVRLRNFIDTLKRNVVQVIYAFVRVGVKNIYTWVKLDTINLNITPFIQTSQTIEDFLDKASLAFFIGSLIATIIGTLVMLSSICTLFYDFKRRVLLARQGVWDYPRKRFSIVNSTSYVGSLISTFLLGYAAIVALLTIIFVPLCHPVTYRIIWANRVLILTILLPTVINGVLKIIAKKCCVQKTHVRFRRCYAVLDLFLLYTAIPAGIVTGLFRFILMLVIGIFTLSKIDTPIIPMWIMKRIMWIDFPNGAYNGLILEHHTHRNPIVTTAMYTFLSCLKPESDLNPSFSAEDEKRIAMSEKGRRIARRFQVALLLTQNPSLIKYRKHSLPPVKKKGSRKGEQPANKSDFNLLGDMSKIEPSMDQAVDKVENLQPFTEKPSSDFK